MALADHSFPFSVFIILTFFYFPVPEAPSVIFLPLVVNVPSGRVPMREVSGPVLEFFMLLGSPEVYSVSTLKVLPFSSPSHLFVYSS